MNKKRKANFSEIVKSENVEKKIKNNISTVEVPITLSMIDNLNIIDDIKTAGDNNQDVNINKNVSRLSLKSKLNNDDVKIAPLFGKIQSSKNRFEMKADEINQVKYAPKLLNLGNSCYLNVVVNILFSTPVFVKNIAELYYKIEDTISYMTSLSAIKNSTYQPPSCLPKSWKLIRNLNDLFDKMKKSLTEEIAPIKPIDLLNTLNQLNENFRLDEQQDAHELLRFILETVREATLELNALRSINESFVKMSLALIYSQKLSHKMNDIAKNEKKRPPKKNGIKNGIKAKSENVSLNIETTPANKKSPLISNFFKKMNVVESGEDILKAANCESVADVVTESFIGFTRNTIRCLECETISSKMQEFLDFGIDVAHKSERCNSKLADSDNEQIIDGDCLVNTNSADDWIKANLKEVEIIRNENKFFCTVCSQHVEAEKMSSIIQGPQIFIVNLKRFTSFSNFSGSYTKCLNYFDIPLAINCIQHDCKNSKHGYELYAIILHAGFSISSGHYIAFVKAINCIDSIESMKTPTNDETKCKLIENNLCNLIVNNIDADLELNKRNLLDNEPIYSHCKVKSDDNTAPSDANKGLNDSWWSCDDDKVISMTSQQLMAHLSKISSSDTPYILLYQRSDEKSTTCTS